MVHLYLIGADLRALMARMQDTVDPETGEIESNLFAELERKLEQKQVAILDLACAIKELRAESDAVHAEAKKLGERKRRLDDRDERLTELLGQHVPVGDKPRDARVEIGWRKSTSVEVTVEPKLLDSIYQRWSVAADKLALGAAMKAGAEVSGAALITRNSIQVK